MELSVVVVDDDATDVARQIGRRLVDMGIAGRSLELSWDIVLGEESVTVRCTPISDPDEAEKEFLAAPGSILGSADLVLLDNDWERAQRSVKFGLELLQRSNWKRGRGPVIAIYTAAVTFKSEFVQEALALGADALINKNETTHFLNILLAALERKKLRIEQQKWQHLSGVFAEKDPALVAVSPAMRRVLQEAAYFAPWRSETVLLLGEVGTGKTRLARAIHESSPRAGFPFVTLDPGSISETLMHAELFGVERGAFTNAHARKGILETAEGGTVFIDELENMAPSMQEALLRVIQDRRYFRPGDPREHQLDVRFFFATNQEPAELVRIGKLRPDFFSRIDQNVVRLPTLCERLEDIPTFARQFVREFYIDNLPGTTIPTITAAALEKLALMEWPDNVRGLRNTIRRSLVRLPLGAELDAEDIVLNQIAELSVVARAQDLGTLLDLAPRAGSQRVVFDRLVQRIPGVVSSHELNQAIGSPASELSSDALMTAISRLRDRLKPRGFDIKQDREQKGYALVKLVEHA